MARSPHPDFCTQGQGKVEEGIKHPICPSPSLWICVQPPTGPRASPGSQNALSPPPVSLSHVCLRCSSCFRPQFHLRLYPLASGKLVSSGPLLFDCLWPNKGAHVHPMHSSASTPANPVLAAQCPEAAPAHVPVFPLQR